MATKTKFQAIKGTRDLLPPETELWNRVEQTAREVFSTYGFGEIIVGKQGTGVMTLSNGAHALDSALKLRELVGG